MEAFVVIQRVKDGARRAWDYVKYTDYRDAGSDLARGARRTWEYTRDTNAGDALKSAGKKIGGAGLAVGGAVVGGAAAAGMAAGRGAARGVTRVARSLYASPEFLIIAFLGIFTIILDWQYRFTRSGPGFQIVGSLYVLLSVIVYVLLRHKGASQREAVGFSVRMFVFSFLTPILVGWLTELAFSGAPLTSSRYFMLVLGAGYLPLYIMYFFGWGKWLLDQLGMRWRFFAILSVFMTMFLLLTILLPLVDTLANAQLVSGQTGIDVPSIKETWDSAVGFTKERWNTVRNGVSNRSSSLLDSATRTYYTGEVEQQQGKPLGVFVRDLLPIQPAYNYGVRGEGEDAQMVLERDSHVTWFGIVQARTFADLLRVELSCIYESDAGNLSVPAVPGDIAISYTGEFVDEYPFDCSIPMDGKLFDIANKDRGLYGRFYVGTNYTFDTWGYTTYTFMDREQFLALRRQNVDPADHLGINSYARAVYTPGPVSLGLERQRQPIPVSLDEPDLNTPMRFGVTIDNLWRGRGDLAKINYLILQVPDPFVLDVDTCAGLDRSVPSTLPELTPIDNDPDGNVIPEGYTGYQWQDIKISQEQRYKTISCPLLLDGDDYTQLLTADLQPQQFTFVAQTNYDFFGKNPVSVRLGVERLG